MTELAKRDDATPAHPDGHSNLPAEELIPNPGLPAHTWRPTDVDEDAAKRAERQVALLFGLSAVCTVLFCVSYFVFEIGDNPSELLGFGASNLTMGLFLGLALTLIGVGTIQWARKLMADTEIVEYRHAASSSEEDKVETLAALRQGASLVLVPDVRGVDLARVVAQEGVTASLGVEVPGTRALVTL